MSIAALQLWFGLAFMLLVGGIALLADIALYRAYPEMKEHDWGWLITLYRRVRRAWNEWRYRTAAKRPGRV